MPTQNVRLTEEQEKEIRTERQEGAARVLSALGFPPDSTITVIESSFRGAGFYEGPLIRVTWPDSTPEAIDE